MFGLLALLSADPIFHILYHNHVPTFNETSGQVFVSIIRALLNRILRSLKK